MHMKRILLWMVCTLLTTTVFAVPAIKKPITVQQADGTTITIYLKGDENTKWYESLDGYSLLKKDNQFFYAVQDGEGNMVASEVKAHNEAERSLAEKQLLQKTPKKLRYSPQQTGEKRSKGNTSFINRYKSNPQQAPLAKAFKARKAATDTMVRRAPVILVNFADRKMNTTKEQYDKLINSRNYTENDCTGSFRDYFLDNSHGLFQFQADVIGPVTLSKKMAYYGENDNSDNDRNSQEMAAEACRLAAAQGADFSKYDFDGDGIVDGVHIIFAGKGEEITAEDNAIWSHAWEIEEGEHLNGKTIYAYSCSGEISYGGTWAYIGTLVHELSHVFGLPDLYDTDYETNGQAVDPGTFDVMAEGAYNGDGKTPPLHNAWSRWQMGWMEKVELKEACTVELHPAEQANTAFMYNTAVNGEYFVLDYRGNESKWDDDAADFPGYGMLIFAVNENVKINYDGYNFSAWEYNCINCDRNKRGFYIKQANGGATSNADMGGGTPFPGTKKVTSFTDETSPSSKSSTGKATNKPITEIATTDYGVKFCFMGSSEVVRDNLGNVRNGGTVVETVANPVFDPAGGEVPAGTKVKITTATQGATIYYTTNGSAPTTSSSVYSAPVALTKTNTILKAMAVKSGMENSSTTTAVYTLKNVDNEAFQESTAAKIYPNPNHGVFSVELPEDAMVEVFNAQGGLLQKHPMNAGKHEMQVSESGNYILRVSSSQGVSIQKISVR